MVFDIMEYDEIKHKNFLSDHSPLHEKIHYIFYEKLGFLESAVQSHILLKYLTQARKNHTVVCLFLSH